MGFQNSGKTAAMEWTIRKLTAKGYSVIAVKHHGHGGFPDPLVKDSTKYRNAGAAASIVEGAGLLHLEITNPKWNNDQHINKPFIFCYSKVNIICQRIA